MKEKLAPCPDCENPVSTSAYFYVHCGRPLPAKPTTTDTVIKVIISAIAVAILFGPITLLLVFLFGAVNAKAAETNLLSLPPEPVTITNLSGKVYANVLLDHPTPDGIICTSQDKTSEGMIRYLDMTTNDLIRLKISPNVLDTAAARNARAAVANRDRRRPPRRASRHARILACANAVSPGIYIRHVTARLGDAHRAMGNHPASRRHSVVVPSNGPDRNR